MATSYVPNKVETNLELAEICTQLAKNFNTVYALGMWGFKITEEKIQTKAKQYPSWYTETRINMLRQLIGKNYWGFDCVCMPKAIFWGWAGDDSMDKGGAVYTANGVPDLGANQLYNACVEKSKDFTNIMIGELCWMDGHVGVYVGNGLSVECTPRWDNKCQFTACNFKKTGYNLRTWTAHAKFPYIKYVAAPDPTPEPTPVPTFKYAVGDIVYFLGGKVYKSSDAATPTVEKPASLAKITSVYNGKHPYHARKIDEKQQFVGGGVYGWVDTDTLTT